MGYYLIIVLISFLASVIGAVCGIGGGVIIKPVLDAMGIIPVDAISFLSGCTVLSMSAISVIKILRKSKKKPEESVSGKGFDSRVATALAIGGMLGGLLGKSIYQSMLSRMAGANVIGAVQAAVLLVVTIGTLMYTLWKERIRTLQITSSAICVLIGALLGMMSAFLGIGGGPINLVVLFFFFSMRTKQAAVYSLYIIIFSQLSSLINSIVSQNVPEFHPAVLILMVLCGIAGGLAGARINGKIKEAAVDKLFTILMVAIILINIYNIFKYIDI